LLKRLNAVFEQAAAKNSESVSENGPAKEKLKKGIAEEQDKDARAALEKDLSEERWRSPFTPVTYLHIRRLIHSSPEDEIREAADDEDLLAAAQRFMAPAPESVPYYQPVPNEFPEFIKALNVNQVGPVQQRDERVVDTAIRTVLGTWVARPAAEGIEIPGHVAILKGRPFAAVQDKYATTLPGAGKVNAFTEGGHIYIATAATDPTTIVHEGIHLYASGVIRRIFGNHIDEGFTEYFARMVAKSAFNVTRDKYPDHYKAAVPIIEQLNPDAVAGAYFGGSVDGMRAHFRNLRAQRHGVRSGYDEDWAAFCALMQDEKYAEAKALLV
jgi:hypothetical protein